MSSPPPSKRRKRKQIKDRAKKARWQRRKSKYRLVPLKLLRGRGISSYPCQWRVARDLLADDAQRAGMGFDAAHPADQAAWQNLHLKRANAWAIVRQTLGLISAFVIS